VCPKHKIWLFPFPLLQCGIVKHKYQAWAFLFAAFVFSVSNAQKNDVYFDRLSVKQGLSHSTVFSLVQDTTGFIWIATQEGLNKYDGYTFTLYQHDPYDSNSISSNWIRKLFVDSKGNLWIISLDGKLDRYLFPTDGFKHYEFPHDSLSDNVRIVTICEDRQGILWLGASSGALFRYSDSGDLFTRDAFSAGKNLRLYTMYFDTRNNLWLGTWRGLFCIENFADNNYKSKLKKLNDGVIFQIIQDINKNIWVASVGQGIFVYDSMLSLISHYRHQPGNPFSLCSDRVSSLFFDAGGRLWAGTIDKGISVMESGSNRFNNFRNDPVKKWSLSKGAIFSFYQDINKVLWICTYGGGISKYDESKQYFKNISYVPGDPGSLTPYSVISICEDKKGGLWIGTDGGGLNYRPKGKDKFFHFFWSTNETCSNTITAICEDYKGNIWIGFDQSDNLFVFDRNKNKFRKIENFRIPNGCVSVLFEDHAHDMWIGTCSKGLFRFIRSKNKIVTYNSTNEKHKLTNNSILSIFEDKNFNLWVGTMHGGLYKILPDRKTVRQYKNKLNDLESISSNSIWCVAEDKNGSLWIGTWGGGLNKLNINTDEFILFTKKNGLPDNTVYAVLPDSSGYLWLSTNKGISRFNINNYAVSNFSQSDGLRNLEFNGGAYCSGKSGKFYFGGIEGVTYFYPGKIKRHSAVPKITLTKFSVFNKPLNIAGIIQNKKVTLSYSQNFFSIEFSVLDYSSPENNTYAYKLEGIDKDWVYSGKNRVASYTNIPPGEYLFKVKGTNGKGVWTNNEATALIKILPPYWQTWWFRLLVLGLIAFILWEIHVFRVNKLLAVERTRNKIAQDLHDEVSATITGIVFFANAVLKEIGNAASQNVKNLLSLIIESSTEASEMMSDIIWSINPENDTWEIVLPKFRRYVSDLCESKDIKYRLEIPEKAESGEISMEQRRNLWLIYKEMVTNAVKHSGCTELYVKISFNKNILNLKVEDNGKGFDVNMKTDRNGIKNIRDRAKDLGGTVSLESSIGKGTKWELLFPLKNN